MQILFWNLHVLGGDGDRQRSEQTFNEFKVIISSRFALILCKL